MYFFCQQRVVNTPYRLLPKELSNPRTLSHESASPGRYPNISLISE
ncbi:hypothetical protein MXB_2009 [Myxobolus squamalis]|nr:hypothetical protein MXB_2009 [Myxobolus squamalis]